MKKIAVSRLACLQARQINKFYRNPGLEKKFLGLSNSVIQAGADTDRLLAMSTMAQHNGFEFYLTFDEAIQSHDVTYLIIRKTARKASKDVHLVKCLNQVALLRAYFELSDGRLATVRRLVDAGYKRNTIELEGKPVVYVLDYNGVFYDVATSDEYLDWGERKLVAVDLPTTAADMDAEPMIAPTYWTFSEDYSEMLGGV